jgi:putative glutamine amidotransferase
MTAHGIGLELNGASSRPATPAALIGVCAAFEAARWSFWEQDAALVPGSYLRAVRRAGGVPLGLLPQESAADLVDALLERVDGLLLIGGADVDPSCYGAARAPETEATYPLRDRFELALSRRAMERDLPVLGICRGLQILNVATGGTLHQDLGLEGSAKHRRALGRLDEPTMHEIEIDAGTIVAAAADVRRERVNSHHHQGVARVGDGGGVVARSLPDGVIEAVEWSARRFAVGVQWHPEALELDALVGRFVDAAAGCAASRRRSGEAARRPSVGARVLGQRT